MLHFPESSTYSSSVCCPHNPMHLHFPSSTYSSSVFCPHNRQMWPPCVCCLEHSIVAMNAHVALRSNVRACCILPSLQLILLQCLLLCLLWSQAEQRQQHGAQALHTASNELRLCSVHISINCITLSLHINLSLTLDVLSLSLCSHSLYFLAILQHGHCNNTL